MAIYLYVYGDKKHCVRVGFTGTRPLIYGIYAFNTPYELPVIAGQTYRFITQEQYEWLRGHLNCDVSYLETDFPGQLCGLECRTHREMYNVFAGSGSFVPDGWDDRQV